MRVSWTRKWWRACQVAIVLSALARHRGRRLLFESVVMDGCPVFNLARCCLHGARVTALSGVLNSTSNFVLTQVQLRSFLGRRLHGSAQMEEGRSFGGALLEAQQRGMTEADPQHDLNGLLAVRLSEPVPLSHVRSFALAAGWDAAVKLSVLAAVLLGVPVEPHEVCPPLRACV